MIKSLQNQLKKGEEAIQQQIQTLNMQKKCRQK